MARTCTVDDAPAREVALVLGCAAGSAYFDDRLATAAALWRAGKARRVRASGGPEADAMGARLAALGVDPSLVEVDPRGRRTLLSMTGARAALGPAAILVVTHRYHLPRALFLARAAGLDAIGVAASEERTREVRARTRWRNAAREAPAWARALVDVAAGRARAQGAIG